MPEPKIKVRLVPIGGAIMGEDSGLNPQEKRALDNEEMKSSKMITSKKFIQSALGKVLEFFTKIAGWYSSVKSVLRGIPGKVLQSIPKLGEWLQSGASILRVGLGSVLQFGVMINPQLVFDSSRDGWNRIGSAAARSDIS